MAVSAAKRLACEEMSVLRSPLSSITADFQVSRREASISVAMSAIMNWIAWCIAIGTPNWMRSLEYSVANSDAARAIERHHRELEAVVLLADQVVGRDLDVVEGDRRGVGRPLAHLVFLLVD